MCLYGGKWRKFSLIYIWLVEFFLLTSLWQRICSATVIYKTSTLCTELYNRCDPPQCNNNNYCSLSLSNRINFFTIRFEFRFFKTISNTLRTGDADLRFYITTVQEGWRKSAFLTRASFPRTIYLIMQYTEPVSEWSCWRMFIETWPHSELTFRHRASSI